MRALCILFVRALEVRFSTSPRTTCVAAASVSACATAFPLSRRVSIALQVLLFSFAFLFFFQKRTLTSLKEEESPGPVVGGLKKTLFPPSFYDEVFCFILP